MKCINLNRRSVFNFDREKIMRSCNRRKDLAEQILYLSFVLLEYQNRPPQIDMNEGMHPDLMNYLKREIDFRSLLLKLNKLPFDQTRTQFMTLN